MKVALIGSGGQLGLEWKAFLEYAGGGIEVVASDSSRMDIRDKDSLSAFLEETKPEVVINCAAYTAVDLAEEEREKARAVNAEAAANMAGLCRDSGIKLLHYSTDYVFAGKREDMERFPKGYPEDHEADPVNWYGQTKWEGEEAIRSSGCDHLIIRLSWLCGSYGKNFVKTMLELAEEKERVDVVDDQWGSPTFAHQAVSQSMELLEQHATGTFHLTSEGLISWADFARKVFEFSAKHTSVNPVTSEQFETKARRPFFSKLDTRKARDRHGIQFQPWEQGLAEMLSRMNL